MCEVRTRFGGYLEGRELTDAQRLRECVCGVKGVGGKDA